MTTVGISGWGAYVPRHRIKLEEICKVWERDPAPVIKGLGVEEKAVASRDEDTITMAVEAARNALARAMTDKTFNLKQLGCLFIGSESHPYAVKPSGATVAEALGISSNFGNQMMVADLEFACKAGTAGLQMAHAFVKSGMIEAGMAMGSDTAQGRPGDALEYTAASGAACFIVSKNPVAELEGTYSFTTDTPSFWRAEGKKYPSHGARFTGEPAYFKHLTSATKALMQKLGLKESDFNHVVFHMPNAKFPLQAAKMLGIDANKLKQGLVVTKIGNTYSGSSPLGLTAILDIAKPGERILVTSYGSGDGSDAFSFVANDKITELQNIGKKTWDYINNDKKYIDYGTYLKLRGKIHRD
ncbi:MAG: hydroxymethylglutaryl-CoA synthase [Candidatus Aenigmarchaeota archaeon]|nr:hydroxymethylglutaryl-CoA synthase [Candidatus Aenigmarchaeota archaeon]